MASLFNKKNNSNKPSNELNRKDAKKECSLNFLGENSQAFNLAMENFKSKINPLDLAGTKTIMDAMYLSGMTNTLTPFIPPSFSCQTNQIQSSSKDIISLLGAEAEEQFQYLDFLSNITKVSKTNTSQKPFSNAQLEKALFSLMNNLKGVNISSTNSVNSNAFPTPSFQTSKELLNNKRKIVETGNININSNNLNNNFGLNNNDKILKNITKNAIIAEPEKNNLNIVENSTKPISDENYWANKLLRPKWKIGFQKSKELQKNKKELQMIKIEEKRTVETDLKLVKPKPKINLCSASISSEASSCLEKVKVNEINGNIKVEEACLKEEERNINIKKAIAIKMPIFKTIGPLLVKSQSEETLPEDSKKIEYKRLLNRKAAKKSRQKKKILISKLIEENSNLRKKIRELEEKINSQSNEIILNKRN